METMTIDARTEEQPGEEVSGVEGASLTILVSVDVEVGVAVGVDRDLPEARGSLVKLIAATPIGVDGLRLTLGVRRSRSSCWRPWCGSGGLVRPR